MAKQPAGQPSTGSDHQTAGHRGDNRTFGRLGQRRGRWAELRFHISHGYRLYFTRRGNQIIVLLCGGDKSSQSRDIARAKAMLKAMES